MSRSSVGAVLTALIVALTVIVGATVYGSINQATGGNIDEQQQATALLDGPGNPVPVGKQTGDGTSPTVYDSRGYALRFSGAPDSYLTSDQAVGVFSGSNWTVMQGAWVNASSAGTNMTVLAVGDPSVILEYRGNQTQATWSAFLYLEGESYRIDVNATHPVNGTIVFVERNGSQVTIYRNSTAGETITVGTESTVTGNLTAAENYHGRLDETRTWDSALSSAQRSDLLANPVGFTLPKTDRTARIMYDAGSGTFVHVFWSAASASAHNATWADGYDGHVMERSGPVNDLMGTSDYEWGTEGPTIKPLAGGELAHAPAAYADYTFIPLQAAATRDFADAIQLAALLPLVIVAGAILVIVQRFR